MMASEVLALTVVTYLKSPEATIAFEPAEDDPTLAPFSAPR